LNIGVCKETAENETRVALTPEGVEKLRKDNLDIFVESTAGELSSYTDEDYKQAGASIVESRDEVLKNCDLLMAVQAPGEADIKKLKKED